MAEAVIWRLERPPHVNIQELIPTDQAAPGNMYTHELRAEDGGRTTEQTVRNE
jgi:hypothetical protein